MEGIMQRQATEGARLVWFCAVLALAVSAVLPAGQAKAAQAPPCHPANSEDISARGDIVDLPADLKARLIELANRPHTYVPLQAFAEADSPSQLFQYYLLDTTGFEPNVFTAIFPGVNDHVMLTASGPNCGLPTIGVVRIVLEPKPGLPTDPNDPRAFNDVFT